MPRIIKTNFEAIENDKVPLKTLKHSLNENLAQTFNTKNLASQVTTVSTIGDGDFLTIKEAVDSGSEKIFIKNGTYTITEDIELENQTLEGETKEGVIINMTEASIIYKETINKTSNGTAQFFLDDKSVDGNNTAFLNLDTSNKFKWIFSDSRFYQVASIQDNNSLELRYKFYGQTNSPTDGTLLLLDQFTFESRANYSSIKNMTINHIINNPLDTIIINGTFINIENVKFFNSNNLSTFIRVSKNDTVISLKTNIERCDFEGAAIGVLINQAFYTMIKNCYFTNTEDRCIEIKNTSRFTKVINNVFTSGLFGIVQNSKNVTYKGNNFKFITNNAISINATSFTTDHTFTKVIDCDFSKCTLDKSFTNDGALLIRGKGTIVRNCRFDDEKVGIQLNCSNTIIKSCHFDNFGFEYAIYTVSGKNNNTISDCTFNGFILFARGTTEYLILSKCAHNSGIPPTLLSNKNMIWMNCIILSDEIFTPIESIIYGNVFEDVLPLNVDSKSTFMDNTVEDGDIQSNTGDKLIICNNILLNPTTAIQNSADSSIICNNLVSDEATPVNDTSTGSQVANNYF